GKPVGSDLDQGKQTLPLVHAFREATGPDRDLLRHQLNNGRKMEHILPLIRKYGGLEYARQKAEGYARDARNAAAQIAPIEADIADFNQLSEFVIRRSY
ncbi:polyprenyl synthetase family protein, partial [bacterium]|nr:polyprenyl synthetase family protein [bacterium]